MWRLFLYCLSTVYMFILFNVKLDQLAEYTDMNVYS